ncbi:uncharacterized protein LOC123507035 [Portunus trituberculatus]|uniref:uncharacterized protein LOC123507035 n=1 Tax=Portunus trituberculatus TaxID=210409 RepID=UPI001E1CC953|nr:uncharacterized protein LOC123507035 [Portunus trituberculatus]
MLEGNKSEEGDTSKQAGEQDRDAVIRTLKKHRGIVKGRFTSKVRMLNNLLLQDNPMEVLDAVYKEISELFDKLEDVNVQILQECSEDEQSQHLDYLWDVQKLKCECHSKIVRLKDGQTRQQRITNDNNCNIQIKKVEPPIFSGDVRDFPTFVKDYTRLVINRHGKDPFILRQSLQGKAREVVGRLDDFDEMWTRLNDRFGSSAKIVDAVLGDICALKPVPEGNKSKLLHMIGVVEQAWLDLGKIGKLHEIENSHSLLKVERLLPIDLKKEWTRKARTLDDTEKFEELVKFLVEERKVIEYMEDDIRTSKTDVKALVNAASTRENVDEMSSLSMAISKLAQSQENCQKQLLDCFNNMAHTMMSITNNNQARGKPYGTGPGRKVHARGCWYHNNPSHDISQCEAFSKLDDASKMESLKRAGACFVCLEPFHMSRDCSKKIYCNVKINNTDTCGKLHHPILHSCFLKEFPMIKAANNLLDREGVLLTVGKVRSGSHTLSTFFDCGSNLTMITYKAARKLGLKGKEISMSLTKVGNQTERIDSWVYTVPLVDSEGTQCTVEAVGFEKITSDIGEVNLTDIAFKLGVDPQEIDRPKGEVDILIGTDYCTLLPTVAKTVGNLQLMKGRFGFCVRGDQGFIDDGGKGLNVFVHHVQGTRIDDFIIKPRVEMQKAIEQFFMTEDLGVSCSPKCGSCRCGRCSLKGHLTIKEEREVNLIENGLTYDRERKRWIAEYPWIRDPNDLQNNYSMAYARLKSTERRLNKRECSYAQKYCEQIQDMIDRGVARKLTKEEMLNYEGPVLYLPHHEVHKPESRSTPLRIVFNSSASYMGSSLNDFLAKGPDCLNILGVLLRFRQDFVGLIGDIKKMYNSVDISLFDQNCHRFLWREMDADRVPDHYALTTVTFGDRPGGAIAMIALRKTSEMSNQCPKAKKLIECNSYVDDLLTSVVDHSEAHRLMKEVEHMLSMGGFEIKEWTVSGDRNVSLMHPKIVDSKEEKVLGLSWDPQEDLFMFKVQLNFSRKMKNCFQGPYLTVGDIEKELPAVLSRRMILRQAASIYDPLGMVTPFTLKMKLLMRELVVNMSADGKKLGWDEAVDEEFHRKWKLLFKEMFEMEHISFKRCLKPKDAVGDPDLVVFSDGSMKAFGAVAYVRWHLMDGSIECTLVASKSKLAPLRKVTVPRLELCGTLLSCRLRQFIEEEMEWSFDTVVHITDSEIVRGQIQKESFRFNTYVGNRIAEIQEKSQPSEWYWVSTDNNVADLCTRGCRPSLLHENSTWQLGPEFLRFPKEDWPISQHCSVEITDELYVREGRSLCTTAEVNVAPHAIDIDRFSDYDKLINVTARVLNVSQSRSLFELSREPNAQELLKAEMLITQVQRNIDENWQTRYQRLGPSQNDKGVIVVGARISKWLKTNWNQEEYVLLLPEHPFTKLLILHLHNQDHSGIEATLSKLQSKYWVPGARKLIKNVKSRCVTCRRIQKVCETQCMGSLPEEKLKPAPPFYNTSLDLFGPFWVKAPVKRRTELKVYGVIFTCMVCRAVYLDIAEGYDTSNFLRTFRRFVSVRGFPKVVHSDRGTQLVKANKGLTGGIVDLDFDELVKFGGKEGMTWKFTRGADAPWQNGCSEALIKSVKRALAYSIGDRVLQFGELQTVFFEVANLINERPIGAKPGCDINLGTYLSPNDLLLGRTCNKAPPSMRTTDTSLLKCFKYVDEVINCFWKKWTRDFFPTLIVRSKWHVEKRNVQPGDVVLVKDSNTVRGKWRLAQVMTAVPGSDNKVRNVTLRYKTNKAGFKYEGQRDMVIDRSVHNIVVIFPVEEQY